MKKKKSNKESQAEERTEETTAFIREVKRSTRRKFNPEEKVRIVLEGFRREVTVRELCSREGISPNIYYSWLKDFMEAGKSRLQRDTVRDATKHEVDNLKRENTRLKQLVGELSLDMYVLKKTAVPELN
jgi:transposase-like protein